MIIKDYYSGSTHIKICDDYLVSNDEAKEILKRIATIIANNTRKEN